MSDKLDPYIMAAMILASVLGIYVYCEYLGRPTFFPPDQPIIVREIPFHPPIDGGSSVH